MADLLPNQPYAPTTAGHSIVFIGMRASGKTTLGKLAADALSWPVIDLDEVLEAKYNQSCGKYIEENGWESFRAAETTILQDTLMEHPHGTVVSCGGGIVESETARELLKSLPVVLHVERHIDDVVDTLEEDAGGSATGTERRPNYGVGVRQVWERREPWFHECSTHHFYVHKGDFNWERQGNRFKRLIAGLQQLPTPNVAKPGASFHTIPVDQIESFSAEAYLREAPGALACDAICLFFSDPASDAASVISDIRNHTTQPISVCSDHLPVLQQAIKVGTEYIEVATYSIAHKPLARTLGSTRIIAHDHLSNHKSVDDAWAAVFELATFMAPYVTGVAVSSVSADLGSLMTINTGARAVKLDDVVTMALGMNEHPLSRYLNNDIGPMLEYAELDPSLLTPQHRYYLFGSPIQGSPSPTLHNCGFEYFAMDHCHYQIADSPEIAKVGQMLLTPTFRGASVTIPHKQDVIQFVDELSESAKAINAVNTLVKRSDGTLLGDNTDWIGIRNLLIRHEAIANAEAGDKVALVVGAGGTALAACHCAKQLNMRLVVFNRTHSKAVIVAERFGGIAVDEIVPEKLPKVDVVIGTVPATSKFTLPEYLLDQKPVVVDVAYKPRRTELLKAAAARGCATHEGIEMLVEQGIEQFVLWSGQKDPPREHIRKTVFEFYDQFA